jgi:acyl carrier protein
VKEAIRNFLTKDLLVEFDNDVDDDSDLFQLGLIDSYAYIELIRFVEREFAIRFTDEEILSNVMVSLSGISTLVSDKLRASA